MMVSSPPPPALLRLPAELHQDIIDFLELPEQAMLAGSCRYFASTIKQPTFEDFLQAEASEWAIARKLYVCKGCRRFRHLVDFSDDMRKGKRGRSGVEASTRFCIRCGVERKWYASGTELFIMGQPHVVRTFTDQRGRTTGVCTPCSPRKPRRIPSR